MADNPHPPRSSARSLLDRLDPEAERTLRLLIDGALITQALYVAAKLGVADQLALGPRNASEIGERVGADAQTLARVLRLLVAQGVFVEGADGAFALNAAAEYLQTGHPRSLRPSAIRGGESVRDVAGRLLEAVQTGSSPYRDVHGADYFERIAAQGTEAEFASRMGSTTGELGNAVAAQPCFAAARTVVDVGGGHGQLLGAILSAHPHVRGVLFDNEGTIATARTAIAAAGLADRCELVSGNFFESVPKGDVHVLSWVLHDWNDEQAAEILRTCRAAADKTGTLLVVEAVLPSPAVRAVGTVARSVPDPFLLDLRMLLLTGGRERTEREYVALLESAGYALKRVISTTSSRGASILEARVNSEAPGKASPVAGKKKAPPP